MITLHIKRSFVGYHPALFVGCVTVEMDGGQCSCIKIVFIEALLQHDDALAIADTRDEVDIVHVVFPKVQIFQFSCLGRENLSGIVSAQHTLEILGNFHNSIAFGKRHSSAKRAYHSIISCMEVEITVNIAYHQIAVVEGRLFCHLVLSGLEFLDTSFIAHITNKSVVGI